MAATKFKTVKLDTIPLQRLQYNTKAVLDILTDVPITDGILVKNVDLIASASNEIRHKLGRAPIGWIITRKRSQADIWDLQDSNKNKTTSLSIACSADVTIDIWIF